MTVLSISEKRKSLYKDISCSLEELLSKTDNYINTFDKRDFFAFSNGSQKNKIYQKYVRYEQLSLLLRNR